jgi:hypothetical protein
MYVPDAAVVIAVPLIVIVTSMAAWFLMSATTVALVGENIM